MCRIVGVIDFNKSLGSELERITVSMRDLLSHGGPDDAGLFISDDRKVALGHRRLSIIDLSSLGRQPMSNSRNNIWITYNGEIYNFQELRNELIKIGCEFKSKTDTEVIIYGYEEWGIEGLLSRLRGMFAFAIYDNRKRGSFKLILARDRFGIKPLYYFKNKDTFIFASEVKAFLKNKLVPDEKNIEAFVRFLQLGSVPVPLTTIKDVYSFPAGHYMVVDETKVDLKEYWNLSSYFLDRNNNINFENAVSNTYDLLLESVKLHLISDVPLGVFLSGGIDSSSLVALASKFRDKENPLTTLSIVFNENKFNEANYSSLIADRYKTNHHEIMLKGSDFLNELQKIFSCMDQPTVDGINTYFISKAAKEAGLTVVLSGLGGDEVFMGYKYFKQGKYLCNALNLLERLPREFRKNSLHFVSAFGKYLNFNSIEKLAYLTDPSIENSYLLYRGIFNPREIQDLLGISEKEYNQYGSVFKSLNGSIPKDLVKSFDYLDFRHYLQNQLLKDTDFMSMCHPVEIRVPFLDHFLVEYVVNLPVDFKIKSSMNKPLLVTSLMNDLPREIWDRPKMGFTFPFSLWLKDNWKEIEPMLMENKCFESKYVKKLSDEFISGKIHWSRVWVLIVLNKALERFSLVKL